MDRYGARGELLAAQHETILGPFLVGPGVDRAFEFNPDGTTTVYEHGRTWTEHTPHITDNRYKLTRNQYASCMADYFYGGFYHDYPEHFFDDFDIVRSKTFCGELSYDWITWLLWARGIVSQVMQDVRVN
ncbi:MAG: hypothetical protein WC477_06410 [Patescibacteria group bacterium]